MIYGAMRVKNEARWIARAVRSLKHICDRVFVLDDHSTDYTTMLAVMRGAHVWTSQFEGLDEVRDKNWLLRKMESEGVADGSWVVMIDGDEELIDYIDLSKFTWQASHDALTLQILYLWDSDMNVRMDGVYGRFTRPSVFRFKRGLSFAPTKAGGNFHCSNVPTEYVGKCVHSGARVLHYGYMDRSDRIRKYEWYNRMDPGNQSEDCYRHMVQGDIPEVPASAKLRHAGPLELRRLEL